jgi:hypothetical protein
MSHRNQQLQQQWDDWRKASPDVVTRHPTPDGPVLRGTSFGVDRPDPIPMLPPPHNGTDTSADAAESVANLTGELRIKIFDWLVTKGDLGATSDEAEVALGLSHQTCSPRILELRKANMVVDSGLRRLTRGGRKAKVWIVAGME